MTWCKIRFRPCGVGPSPWQSLGPVFSGGRGNAVEDQAVFTWEWKIEVVPRPWPSAVSANCPLRTTGVCGLVSEEWDGAVSGVQVFGRTVGATAAVLSGGLVQRFAAVAFLIQAALAALHHVNKVGQRLLLVHWDVPEVTAHRLRSRRRRGYTEKQGLVFSLWCWPAIKGS